MNVKDIYNMPLINPSIIITNEQTGRAFRVIDQALKSTGEEIQPGEVI